MNNKNIHNSSSFIREQNIIPSKLTSNVKHLFYETIFEIGANGVEI